VQIAVIVYDAGTASITATQTLPVIVPQPLNQVYDLFYALGPFNISGNEISADGANRSFNKAAGTLFATSFNHFAAGVLTSDPHVASIPAQTPVTFRHLPSVPAAPAPLTTLLDVGNYDVGGVVTPVGGGANSSTIFRVFLSAANNIQNQVIVQYGQTTYTSLANATNAIGNTPYVVSPGIPGNAALIGYIAATRTATNLSDPTQAEFRLAHKFSRA